MSVQLSQQTRSTRFSRGSLPDWYTWKCSVKNSGQKQCKQMKDYFLSWQSSLINSGYLLSSLPSLLPKDTPGKFQPFLKAGAILGSWDGPLPATSTNSSNTSPGSHMTYSMDLLRSPYPYYFSHHLSLPNMSICLLPMLEGKPLLALMARFPAIHQSLKVYRRH